MSVSTVILLIVAVFAATVVALVLLRPVLLRYALARPNARSSHKVPTPQGGGIAVVGATLIAMVVSPLLGAPAGPRDELAVVVAGALALAIAGVVDDTRGLGPLPRFGLQMIAVGAMVATLPDELRVVPWLPLAIERALVVIGGVWLVNLTNFMDGIDWMTVVEVVPVATGLALLGALGALPPHASTAALALAAALLGFAPFNKPVARVFLGDVGSVPIGLLLVWMLTLLAGRGHLAAAVLLPLYYLADATITLLRRLARRERVWEAHRTHFYQRATDHGLGVMAIVMRVLAVNVVLTVLAVWTVVRPSPSTDVLAVSSGCALVGVLLVDLSRRRR